MLATAGLMALAVTQSTPAITPLVVPLPPQPSTLTPWSGAPGATPTTSWVLSFAATVPDTWVPWPLQSLLGPPAKLTCCTTFRSGCVTSMPVSMMYTLTLDTAPLPLPASVEEISASIRSIPQGSVCATAYMGWSASTYLTRASAWRVATARGDRTAANPCSACSYTKSGTEPLAAAIARATPGTSVTSS